VTPLEKYAAKTHLITKLAAASETAQFVARRLARMDRGGGLPVSAGSPGKASIMERIKEFGEVLRGRRAGEIRAGGANEAARTAEAINDDLAQRLAELAAPRRGRQVRGKPSRAAKAQQAEVRKQVAMGRVGPGAETHIRGEAAVGLDRVQRAQKASEGAAGRAAAETTSARRKALAATLAAGGTAYGAHRVLRGAARRRAARKPSLPRRLVSAARRHKKPLAIAGGAAGGAVALNELLKRR
jgi:hypothetical protein